MASIGPKTTRRAISRVFAPEILPQLGLLVAAICAFVVAIRTLNHMRESSERQLRAYVMPENTGLFEGSVIQPPQPARNGVPGVAMVIENSGQTPAYNVVSWLQIDVIPIADEARLTPPPMQEQFSTTLAGGATFTKSMWFHRPLAATEIADIATGIRGIYAYGRIEYRDGLQKTSIYQL